MNYLPLIGILIIVLGFILKLDTTAMVVLSAIVTAVVSGINIIDAISKFGEYFVANRATTIAILPVPIIALAERNGLREQAANIIKRMKKLTAPIFLFFYFIIRQIGVITSIPFGGHAQVVRPIVFPMAEAAAAKDKTLSEEVVDNIKAKSAAADNVANFFAQNVLIGSSGVLLISRTLESLGYSAPTTEIVKSATIMAFCAALVFLVVMFLWNRQLKKGAK